MADILKPGAILFLITLVASALLGAVNGVTKDTIAANDIKTKNLAMAEVLTTVLKTGDRFDTEIKIDPVPEEGVLSYAAAYSGETVVGYAVTVKQPAYSGKIDLLVGVDATGTVTGIQLLKHTETAGLGANAAKESFRSQFVGKKGVLSVTKSGAPTAEEINAIASATISSRAVTDGVNTATAFVRDTLLAGKGAAE